MAVVIGVAGESHIEIIFQRNQRSHGVGRRTVHADLAVPIEAHEAERRVDLLVDDGQPQAVAFSDTRPIRDAGAAERIDRQIQARRRERLHIDHGAQLIHIIRNVVVAVRGGRAATLFRSGTRAKSRIPSRSSALA